MKKTLLLFLAAVTFVAALTVGAIQSRGAIAQVVPKYDVTPPVLNVPLKPSFVVGNVLNSIPDLPYLVTDIQQTMSWSSPDALYYDFGIVPTGGPPGLILEQTDQTSYSTVVSDYDDEQGGGSMRTDGWYVTAWDYSHNATTRRIYGGSGNNIITTQEDGSWKDAPFSPYGTITYSGAWSQVNCTCFLNGHTRRTSSLNARATFTHTYESGDHVALVMAKGPGRGRAAIRVDGVIVSTIDTYAAANTNRVVVFERMMAGGTHTLSVTNLATSGRSRIDVDAVITN